MTKGWVNYDSLHMGERTKAKAASDFGRDAHAKRERPTHVRTAALDNPDLVVIFGRLVQCRILRVNHWALYQAPISHMVRLGFTLVAWTLGSLKGLTVTMSLSSRARTSILLGLKHNFLESCQIR
ncbi:hypothetical protein HZ326_16103 [Fusarium oxysporum f. sp. albedinis]|nr:hypothetical protein HZ326_16103 [Fusarium oxysporum f. sp. albedinis]